MALPQHLSTELICQLLLDLFDFTRLAVVAQCPGHFLVGHLLAIALLSAPAVCQCFLVFGRKLESPLLPIHPPDALLHVPIPQEVEEKLVQTDFFLVAWETEYTKFAQL